MSNGRLTLARLIASTVITLACLGCSVYLAIAGHEIPQTFAIIEVAGVAGVVGVDVVASVLSRVKS